MWLASWFVTDANDFYSKWNVRCHINVDRTKELLGMEFRPVNESLVDMANSLIDLGIVEDKRIV